MNEDVDALLNPQKEQWDAIQEQIQERMSQLEGSDAATYEAWAEDARQAWDDGRAFYQPLIPAVVASRKTPARAKGAEMVLQAIAEAGWQLHTWALSPSGPAGVASARPLFIRPVPYVDDSIP